MTTPTARPPYWTYAALGVAGGMAIFFIVTGMKEERDPFLTAGIVGLFATVIAAPVALNSARVGSNRALIARIDNLAETMRSLAEQQALSDDARRVLNRTRERELLRKAILEDIAAEDWDAATILVKELAERFGYRLDAEEFRQRIEESRRSSLDKRVSESIRNLDALILRAEWEQAAAEAASITRLYPDSPRTEGLRHRVAAARERYKMDLERRFLHAAEDGRNDEAYALLKELDAYLTPEEAEPFTELARGVIGKARDNLGVHFKLACQDRDWRHAADLGERIIREFPNTRMAQEVREILDRVREQAKNMPLTTPI